MTKTIIIIFFSLVFSGCTFHKSQVTSQAEVRADPISALEEKIPEYKPVDPIEIFLVDLTKSTNLPFDNPVKSDIFWSEGESPDTLKVFFGDSFLIKEPNSTLEKEKIVSDFLLEKGFVSMKFNGSIGENSRKMGYRKDDLICKTDFSIYPGETAPHLVVYCSDATKGTLRK